MWTRVVTGLDETMFFIGMGHRFSIFPHVAMAMGPKISNLDFLWNNENVSRLQLNSVIDRLHDQYLQGFYAELHNSSKLSTYNEIKKKCFTTKKYLTCVKNAKHRIALTRFRCSAHKLAIEEGRFRNSERNVRLCTKCNMQTIENEYHFLMACPLYSEIRNEFLLRCYCVWPTQQKFINLMTSTQQSILRKSSKFVYCAYELRNSHV